jgi:hypothetical protein
MEEIRPGKCPFRRTVNANGETSHADLLLDFSVCFGEDCSDLTYEEMKACAERYKKISE